MAPTMESRMVTETNAASRAAPGCALPPARRRAGRRRSPKGTARANRRHSPARRWRWRARGRAPGPAADCASDPSPRPPQNSVRPSHHRRAGRQSSPRRNRSAYGGGAGGRLRTPRGAARPRNAAPTSTARPSTFISGEVFCTAAPSGHAAIVDAASRTAINATAIGFRKRAESAARNTPGRWRT